MYESWIGRCVLKARIIYGTRGSMHESREQDVECLQHTQKLDFSRLGLLSKSIQLYLGL